MNQLGRVLAMSSAVVWMVGLMLGAPLRAQAILDVPPSTSPTYVEVPPVQQQVITEAPSPAHVWVPGRWERTAGTWTWKAGTWVKPPFRNAYWVPGYWRHNNGQLVWLGGHWAVAKQGVVVAKPVTVPPIYEEAQPAAPAATGYVWQPGYWSWRGTWVWVPGQYIKLISPEAVWVAGAWEATPGGLWRWNPAHWAFS
jgi:WXXGXW repeat (2 copies)